MFEGLGRTQQDLLSALLYKPAGMSIEELAGQLAVTRTAVRQHLSALERDDLVTRGELRATGRRPEQLYQLSRQGQELFPRHYHLLANLLIGEVASLIGEEALIGLMRSLGEKIARDLSATRLDEAQIAARMKEVGYEAEVFFRSGGPVQIVAHNCVFHQLAEAHPQICELDLALIGSLGGGQVQHLECMLRGGQVCRFQLLRDAS
ncbi:Helix-turn-helix domain protein [compost metagenome]|uniref:helix-turn-helix transcriptional regulator n=1 Tax=Pseudomonas TaxID=286 RepID=UPI0004133EFD|nr:MULTISPECIES: HTH domain-containing protein [Pseudomonas]MCW2270954.1 putative ArsR family transcriptional regulator [Pseudomonas sp. JUb96]PRA65854.1 transcriptional regulator [Pseudomonas sp. MYb187]